MKQYQFKSFFNCSGITHGISTASFGSMKQLDMLKVDRNALSKFTLSAGVSDQIVYMKQIHSGNVSVVKSADLVKISDTDGLLTGKRHIPLGVLTADCLPILLYDPKRKAIGIAHAGYKGLLHHIIENMISRFIIDFESDPKDILIGIGPSIEISCYEVDKSLIEEFQKTFPTSKKMFIKKNSRYYLDLRMIARQCLLKQRILEEHIEIMDVCTKCDQNFYSYRRGDGERRFVSIISLI